MPPSRRPSAGRTPAALSPARARALAVAAQGFPARTGAALVETVERTGFVRTIGGVEAYLALRARVPGLTRADVDTALERSELQVVPAARGCMYVVPRKMVPTSLAIAAALTRARDQRDQARAGIRPGELDALSEIVHATLRREGPLTPAALRKLLPEGATRGLGSAGKKVGISSPLPAALRQLELARRIERRLETGRLDSERYRWRVGGGRTPARSRSGEDLATHLAALADTFFTAAGIASTRDFAAWAGVTQAQARDAVASAGLHPVAIEGVTEPQWLPSPLASTLDRRAEIADTIAFLPFEDNLTALRASAAFLVDPAHHAVRVPVWGCAEQTTLGEARHLALRPVLVADRYLGFWEWDPNQKEVALGLFEKPGAALAARLDDEAERLGRFLRDELGHGRSFSLDTDQALTTRADQVRAIGGARRRSSKRR